MAEAIAQLADPTETTADAVRRWHSEWTPALSRGFEATSNSAIECHLVPFFGDLPLASVRASDAARFAGWMTSRGKAAGTTRTALSILRRVLQLEVEAGTLRRNALFSLGRVLRGVSKREARHVSEVEVYTLSEIRQTISIASEVAPWLADLLFVLAATGMRRGEALGLQWQDLDWMRGEICVRRSRVRGRESSTKTGAGRRVPMDITVLPLSVVLTAARSRAPGGLVLRSRTGCALDEGNVSRRWRVVRDLAVRAGVRRLRLHDLRHTFASHALEAGWNVRRVASWMGHSSADTTLRVYAHVLPDGELLVRREAPRVGPVFVRHSTGGVDVGMSTGGRN